jgi:DNA primase
MDAGAPFCPSHGRESDKLCFSTRILDCVRPRKTDLRWRAAGRCVRCFYHPRGAAVNDDRVAVTQQVKAANDIVEVVGGYISLRPFGPTFKGLCPFHDDHRPSFDVDPRRQRYRCWACNKFGDVISFVQEFERVSFPEALELLARRAGISLEKVRKAPPGPDRASMLDVAKWSAEQFQQCLLDSPHAEAARRYLGERKLAGEVVRRFGLGFAPALGDWLVQKAATAKISVDLLETVGLIARRPENRGYYDRFRDRVIFPIRDVQGRTVGFGGRVLPGSPLAERGPKYYNSAETPLFNKSEQLYGIDQARQAATKAGYLAVVEGYTDVMMAHQHGIANIVSTMGTALNAKHIRKLRGLVQRVVLLFDADAGGDTGVDRALELFVTHDLDLRVATLPEGLDPCDMLVRDGPEPFRKVLEAAIDVFTYKLQRVWSKEAQGGLEGKNRAVSQMIDILAKASDKHAIKVELMVRQIASKLGFMREFQEETIWAQLKEKRASQRSAERAAIPAPAEPEPERQAKADLHAVRLLEVLLAHPGLVAEARELIEPAALEHPGLRQLLEGLYQLSTEGVKPDLDHLRERLHNERLLGKAQQLQERGYEWLDGAAELRHVLARFRERQVDRVQHELRAALAAGDVQQAAELQRELKELTSQETGGTPGRN